MSLTLVASRHESRAQPSLSEPLVVAVAGNPNAGKTTLFNALTGLKQKVANYPGVTVESKIGHWSLAAELSPARLIDLPGLYSLNATSVDEEIARNVLLGNGSNTLKPDAIVVAVDATNLTRNLYLAIQLIETRRPVVVALTMFDLAERSKIRIDPNKLSRALRVPVIPFIASERRGSHELAQAVLAVIAEQHCGVIETETSLDARSRESRLIKRYALIERIVNEVVEVNDLPNRTVSERIDRIVLHRVFGPLLLLLVMALVFQTIFSWANMPMDLIDRLFGILSAAVRTHLPPGILTDLINDGAIAGVGSVLVFVPQIFLLFLFISLLEDSGYMARAAFIMDRLMRCFGLPGKSFIPLLSGFACTVPGIMATRTIEDPKDRLATILITPFMSCSARLPIYSLMIATLFSGQKVFGFISTGVLVILVMYLLGIAVALSAAAIFNRTILKAPKTTFVMELPPFRLPILRNVAQAIKSSVGSFVKRAGTVILAVSILLWALAAFPRTSGGSGARDSQVDAQERSAQIRNSYAGRMGRLMEPAIAPLGFDWRIGVGLITSFAARETIVSTLSVVYNVDAGSTKESATLTNALLRARRDDGSPVWTPLVGLSFMVFFLLSCQCMSTIAVVRRETNSLRWAVFMFIYMLVIAYAGSLITYHGGRLLGFS
jgi:ferrous iron transport protein B